MTPNAYSKPIDRHRRTVLRVIGAGATLPLLAGHGDAKQVRTVVDFDPPDQPENLAIDADGNVFMSMPFTGEIRKLPAGLVTETGLDEDDTELVATITDDGPLVLGIEVDKSGTIFAASTNFDPGAPSAIWSIDDTGAKMKLATLPNDAFPNGVLIDAKRERLLISDSFRGEVWAVDLDSGDKATWLDDPLLDPGGFVGANGLALSREVLYVANLDFGRIVQAPIEDDGSAGPTTVLVEDSSLVGADGITFHNPSMLYVAVNAQDAIRRVNGKGKIKTVVSGQPLDAPSDVAFHTVGRGRLFVTNFALESAPEAANPALLVTHP